MESDGSDSDEALPLEVASAAKAATLDLLPGKSRGQYENEYERFKSWCDNKNIKKTSETVLLAYFSELAKIYKSSSLWSKYSMVKAVLSVRENIDASRFSKLIAFLKRKSDGYKPKKSKIFVKEELDRFILEAPDQEFLMMKVFISTILKVPLNYSYLLFNILGCCNNGCRRSL